MSDKGEVAERFSAGAPLTPEQLSVLGADLAPTFSEYLRDHHRGALIPTTDLITLLRAVLLRSSWRTVAGRELESDRRWLQERMLEFVYLVAWYLAGPRLRLVPRGPDGVNVGMVA